MSKKIVLIDDDPEDIEIMLEVLKDEKFNYNAAAFNDPCYALEILKAMPERLLPDYIILDVNMPKMDGLECMRELLAIEQLRNVTYLVHTTGSPDAETTKSFQTLGVTVRKKPSTLADVLKFFESLQ